MGTGPDAYAVVTIEIMGEPVGHVVMTLGLGGATRTSELSQARGQQLVDLLTEIMEDDGV